MLTLRESIINMAYYNYDDIKSGQIIECTAKMFHKGALVVKVMGKISGYIPSMHLSDIPLINPEKKFKAGKVLKCKVLIVKPNDMKLILTNKKMLVKS
ncbi:hypothetical protein HELRODRAFT_62671, partial [Helobdella robusta]|uniref:S1 motif domain-containing protein n=1 Tax=Helobdella robusta TaxID=6412 RepID=T1FX34_HELRO